MWSGFGVMWSGTSVAGIFVKDLKIGLASWREERREI
jgi:hypothetical protein